MNEIPVNSQIVHRTAHIRGVVGRQPKDTPPEALACVFEGMPRSALFPIEDILVVSEDDCPHCHGTGKVLIQSDGR